MGPAGREMCIETSEQTADLQGRLSMKQHRQEALPPHGLCPAHALPLELAWGWCELTATGQSAELAG